MRSTFIVLCISSILFSGCSDSDSSADNNSIDTSIVSKPNPENTGVISTDPTIPNQAAPNVIQTLPGTATAPVITTTPVTSQPVITSSTPTATPTVTAPGMNPPHGQPGHRCEIAVGAPLNSAPAKPATTTPVTSQPVITSTPVATPAATPTVTAPGMNPPHGQPGHKCEIAVGAPLNSAPAKTNVPKSETITNSANAIPAGIEIPVKAPANDSSRKQ